VIDDRMNSDLITEVMHVLDRHGYIRGDNQHVALAIGTIIDLAGIYEGTPDHPGPFLTPEASFPQPAPEPPGPANHDAVIVSPREVQTLLAALDQAAEYKRDLAATCADCTDQSCGTCQWRLQTARDYDQMAAQMLQAAQATQTANANQPEPDGPPAPPARPHPEADREAGQ
jgi:ferredoxin